jgi:hypothetical protein
MFCYKRPDGSIVFLLTASFVSASKMSVFGIIVIIIQQFQDTQFGQMPAPPCNENNCYFTIPKHLLYTLKVISLKARLLR